MRLKILALGHPNVTHRISTSIGGKNIDLVCLSEIPESIALLKQERFDLALVDSHMEGVESVCNQITWLCRTTVVLVTKGKEPDWGRLRHLEVDGFISDESEPNEFIARMLTIVRRQNRQFTRARILIIEPDEQIQETLSLSFKIFWPEAVVYTFAWGEDGIRFASRESVDVILLDLVLPGPSGFEVMQQLRSFTATPIVVMTAARDEGEVIKALKSGADDYLIKPFRQAELLSRVRRHVNLIFNKN
jgi:DNA-binding response OmpR family regulator